MAPIFDWLNRRPPAFRFSLLVVAAFSPVAVLVSWASVNGLLVSDSCSALEVPLALWPGKHRPIECLGMPLAADWPSWLLALTSSLSNLTSLLTFCRVRSLETDLRTDGLLVERHQSGDGAKLLDNLTSLPSRRRLVLNASLILVVAIVLYFATYSSAAYVQRLAEEQVTSSGTTGEEQATGIVSTIRDHWWANIQNYPVGALLFLSIGAIGTWTAILQIQTISHVFSITERLESHGLLRLVDDLSLVDHGWRSMDKIVTIRLGGMLTFVPAYAALFMILAFPVWGLVTLVLLAVGVSWNTWRNLSFSTSTVPQIQRRIVVKELSRVAQNLEVISQPRPRYVLSPAYVDSRFRRVELLFERAEILRMIEVPKNRVLRATISLSVGAISLVGLAASVQQLFSAMNS